MKRVGFVMLMIWIGVAAYGQATPARYFTTAVHGVTRDTTLQNWKVLSVQKLKVSFEFSAKNIKMVMPLHAEVMPILKTYRKNGAIIYLIRHTKTKAVVMLDGKDLRYIVKTNQNRFFQTCYQ